MFCKEVNWVTQNGTVTSSTELTPSLNALGYVASSKRFSSRLRGVVVSVLATGPKGCGFEPGKGDGFLRAIKISSTSFSRMGSKAGRSYVVRFYGV
jgi:hypothetical protein